MALFIPQTALLGNHFARLHTLPHLAPCLALAPCLSRCRLALVCRTFQALFSTSAFTGRPMRLNLNSISWRLLDRKRRAVARQELVAAVARVAPSVTHLCLRYQLDASTCLSMDTLLAPLAGYVQVRPAGCYLLCCGLIFFTLQYQQAAP